jgi:hypothetical protein
MKKIGKTGVVNQAAEENSEIMTEKFPALKLISDFFQSAQELITRSPNEDAICIFFSAAEIIACGLTVEQTNEAEHFEKEFSHFYAQHHELVDESYNDSIKEILASLNQVKNPEQCTAAELADRKRYQLSEEDWGQLLRILNTTVISAC